jgi:hypothetical protein
MRDCNLYGPASSVTINGAANNVNLQNCYGTEFLNMADSTGQITISNCLFPTYSISTPNQVITNLRSSGARVPAKFDKVNSSEGSVSLATATPLTVAATSTDSITLVAAYVPSASVNESCSGIVVGGVISNVSNGSTMSLSVSGTNIQITQTTGVTQNVRYSVLKLK